jgi:hypothetical protein
MWWALRPVRSACWLGSRLCQAPAAAQRRPALLCSLCVLCRGGQLQRVHYVLNECLIDR